MARTTDGLSKRQPLKLSACNYLNAEVGRMRSARLASILLSVMSVILLPCLLPCLTIQAHAIEPGDIAVPSITGANMDMPVPTITKPNMDTPEPNSGPQVKTDSNPDQTLNQTAASSPSQTQATPTRQEAGPMDVSGKWSIRFNDRAGVSLGLTLWSAGGTNIMGFGDLMDGNAKNSVAASGSFRDPELILTVKSAAPKYAGQRFDGCDLDLFMVYNTLSGTYVLMSGGQPADEGNATAVRLLQ